MQLPLFRRLLSYLYPVKVWKAAGITTPFLQLYLYQGRWQLASATALYSDGHHYRPLKAAFRYLLPRLQQARQMLVLGAGLGSAATILDRLQCTLPVTLVDIDPTILAWGEELLPERIQKRSTWLLAEAREFALQHDRQYDVLVIDLFQDRIVPAFVTSAEFLSNCRRLLSGPDSILVLNYIINNDAAWEQSLSAIRSVYTIEKILDLEVNQVIIARLQR